MPGVYDSAERSANVKKQLRDKVGKWIDMGGKIKFFAKGVEQVGNVLDFNGDYVVTSYVPAGSSGHAIKAKIHKSGVEAVGAKADLDVSKAPSADKPEPSGGYKLYGGEGEAPSTDGYDVEQITAANAAIVSAPSLSSMPDGTRIVKKYYPGGKNSGSQVSSPATWTKTKGHWQSGELDLQKSHTQMAESAKMTVAQVGNPDNPLWELELHTPTDTKAKLDPAPEQPQATPEPAPKIYAPATPTPDTPAEPKATSSVGSPAALAKLEAAAAKLKTTVEKLRTDLEKYTTPTWYPEINDYLRKGKPKSKPVATVQKLVDSMDAVVNSHEVSSPITVYRGVHQNNDPNNTVIKMFDEQVKPGAILTDLGFVSTTTKKDYAGQFANKWGHGGYLIELQLNPGDTALDIESFRKHFGKPGFNESEFLLPRGTSLKVESVEPYAKDPKVKHVKVSLVKKDDASGNTGPDTGVSNTGGESSGTGGKAQLDESGPAASDSGSGAIALPPGTIGYDENNKKYVSDPNGKPIYVGTTVKSNKDGFTGTVKTIEGNGEYIKVVGPDGKVKGRKISTMSVVDAPSSEAPTPVSEPSAPSRPEPDEVKAPNSPVNFWDDDSTPDAPAPPEPVEKVYAPPLEEWEKELLKGTDEPAPAPTNPAPVPLDDDWELDPAQVPGYQLKSAERVKFRQTLLNYSDVDVTTIGDFLLGEMKSEDLPVLRSKYEDAIDTQREAMLQAGSTDTEIAAYDKHTKKMLELINQQIDLKPAKMMPETPVAPKATTPDIDLGKMTKPSDVMDAPIGTEVSFGKPAAVNGPVIFKKLAQNQWGIANGTGNQNIPDEDLVPSYKMLHYVTKPDASTSWPLSNPKNWDAGDQQILQEQASNVYSLTDHALTEFTGADVKKFLSGQMTDAEETDFATKFTNSIGALTKDSYDDPSLDDSEIEYLNQVGQDFNTAMAQVGVVSKKYTSDLPVENVDDLKSAPIGAYVKSQAGTYFVKTGLGDWTELDGDGHLSSEVVDDAALHEQHDLSMFEVLPDLPAHAPVSKPASTPAASDPLPGSPGAVIQGFDELKKLPTGSIVTETTGDGSVAWEKLVSGKWKSDYHTWSEAEFAGPADNKQLKIVKVGDGSTTPPEATAPPTPTGPSVASKYGGPIYVGSTIKHPGAKGYTGKVVAIESNGQYVKVLVDQTGKKHGLKASQLLVTAQPGESAPNANAPAAPAAPAMPKKTYAVGKTVWEDDLDQLPAGTVVEINGIERTKAENGSWWSPANGPTVELPPEKVPVPGYNMQISKLGDGPVKAFAYDTPVIKDFTGASPDKYNEDQVSVPSKKIAATSSTADPTSPLFGKPEPKAPTAPVEVTGPYVDDAWLDKVKQRYLDNPNKAKASLDKSGNWGLVQNVINSGTISALDSLLQYKYIDQDMYDDAKAQIEAHNAKKDTANKKFSTQTAAYTKKLEDWRAANGVLDAASADDYAFAPELSTEPFYGGDADWTKGHVGTPTLVSALDKLSTSEALAKQGVSVATDGGGLEDLDLRLRKVVDKTGKKRTEITVKLTSAAGDNLAKTAEKSGATVKTGVSLPRQEFTPDGFIKDMTAGTIYHTDTGKTFTFTDPETGVTVEFRRASNSTSVTNPSVHNTARVLMPENATTQDVEAALSRLGVSATPASEGDIRVYAENKILSVFGGKTDVRTNLTGPERAKMLSQLETKYGITPDKMVFTHDMEGRVKFFLTDDVRDKLVKDLNVKAFNHNVHLSNADQWVDMIDGNNKGLLSTYNRWTSGIHASGSSSQQDMKTGGADYMFTTPLHQTPSPSGYGGSVIIHPLAAMRRVDIYGNANDSYGKHHDSTKVYDLIAGQPYEIMFKHGIPLSDIWYVNVGSSYRQAIIDKLKARGVTQINGVPVEQFVLSGGKPPEIDPARFSIKPVGPASIEATPSAPVV